MVGFSKGLLLNQVWISFMPWSFITNYSRTELVHIKVLMEFHATWWRRAVRSRLHLKLTFYPSCHSGISQSLHHFNSSNFQHSTGGADINNWSSRIWHFHVARYCTVYRTSPMPRYYRCWSELKNLNRLDGIRLKCLKRIDIVHH